MTVLLKDDIPVLDFIIDELCKNRKFSSITAKYLGDKKVFGFGKENTFGDLFLNETDEKEFERLASIIKESGKAKVNEQLFENPLSISRNSETLHFKKQGGFDNIFKKQNKKPELSLFEKLSILGFIITFFYGFYQNEKSNTLENQYEKYRFELDSLKFEFKSLNEKTDSLVFELKKTK